MMAFRTSGILIYKNRMVGVPLAPGAFMAGFKGLDWWVVRSMHDESFPVYIWRIYTLNNVQDRSIVTAFNTLTVPTGKMGENKAFQSTSHHGPAVSRFFVSNGSTNGAGCLRGLLRLIKTHFENISGTAFWDRDPRYPNRVPWDQKKILKKFLMESYLGLSS